MHFPKVRIRASIERLIGRIRRRSPQFDLPPDGIVHAAALFFWHHFNAFLPTR
jgi:hypothetical protein